ncbi:MAG: bifunctional nuclease family protein [Planctomycetota bacterium]|jgi:bifunctional DNase/RNase
MNFIECEVSRLVIDEDSQSGQMVALREKNGPRSMPIIIGMVEAWAINQRLSEGATFPRPLTHDLFANTLTHLNAELIRVLITELREGTFYALLELRRSDGSTTEVDCRPSDGLALAVRTNSPIFVSEPVLDQVMSGE